MYDNHVVINVSKDNLLIKLEENRERYVNSIDALKAGWAELNVIYQKDYADWFAKNVAGTLGDKEKKPQPPEEIEDKTDDYNLWVEMLENAVGEHIELNEENFNLLWRDNWTWMKIHTDSIRAYACTSMSISVDTLGALGVAASSYNISI